MEPWLTPLYDAEGIRAVDRWAIEEQGVPSAQLMRAAARALAEAVAGLSPQGPVRVLCGKGNNGGDGEIAAGLLGEMGFEVATAAVFSEGAPADYDAWLAGAGCVVDAIFGTGFSGAPREPAAAAIEAINRCGAPVVACDIASGVDASTGEIVGAAVEADLTVGFHAAKLGQRIAPGKWHTGELRVAPIGIPIGDPVPPAGGTIDPAVLALPPSRGSRSTKFSSGQVTIAGGSRGLTGAVRMSSMGAIRAGAGYATVAVPAELQDVFAVGQPEVMSRGCPGGDGCLVPASAKALLAAFGGAAAGVLGPGLGRDPGSVELVRDVVALIEAPLVIDADGLGALAGRLGAIAARQGPTILTPHAGELGRLLERDSGEIDAHRLAAAREAAAAADAVVILKGDDTIVTDGDRIGVNVVSAPGLATAGTGDVLSGITAALLARGLEPFAAACAAVLAHARAGRDAARRIGAAESVIAGDVIDSIAVGLLPAAAVE
ncbi:MAG: ADP-dependent NAD(P)H-hydrate dehydratase / NAD(P)H-hydrate epimerase [Solirubrobacterales bacterium]|jgi:NAD(P)H-hydrate epimerase|nr:ADP-dependent NAD(P)H-hydrate dehydratase / NAD(P)H-hydrate epimerase [Solirubrobacterales bacterium]